MVVQVKVYSRYRQAQCRDGYSLVHRNLRIVDPLEQGLSSCSVSAQHVAQRGPGLRTSNKQPLRTYTAVVPIPVRIRWVPHTQGRSQSLCSTDTCFFQGFPFMDSPGQTLLGLEELTKIPVVCRALQISAKP